MIEIDSKLTIIFENPFWIGIFERKSNGYHEVAKVVFGAEPRDVEVYEFILKKFSSIKYHKVISDDIIDRKNIGYKRMKRKIKKQQGEISVGTKARNIIKAQYEENKINNKNNRKIERNEQDYRKFQLKQQKKKEKHKGH